MLIEDDSMSFLFFQCAVSLWLVRMVRCLVDFGQDVACTPRVYTLWQKLRWDSSDRLAFYLQHTEAPTQLAA